ncbi:hypothetical protein [Tychonema sp. LEGE 07203]|nr:hypothetical protein [Tychonema sp. LEGE 07203]
MIEGLFHMIQTFKNKALEKLLREGNAKGIPKELEKGQEQDLK